MNQRASELERTIWWPSRRPRPVERRLAADVDVEVAVIGAGFTGLTAAWHLARRGVNVAVLEAQTIGCGASGLNAGFVVPNLAKADPAAVLARLGETRGRLLLDMVSRGGDRVFSTARENAIDCDALQSGWMHVAHTREMLAVLRTRAAAWQAMGRPVRILDEAEARERTSMRQCVGALIDDSGGTLDPLAYAYGLGNLAVTAGAEIYQDSPVDQITRVGNRWQLRSGGSRVSAAKVLLCTNASPRGVAHRLFKAVVPLHVYQIATEPLPPVVVRRISAKRNPVADTRANLFTYRLTADNRLISGGMSMLPVGAHDRMARMIVQRLHEELALSSVPQVAHVWRGTAAMTMDFLPHVYEFGPHFFAGIGCNGRGVALTAMVGEVLADAASGRPLSALPVPVASTRGVPFHWFAQLAPSVAIAQARMQDARTLR